MSPQNQHCKDAKGTGIKRRKRETERERKTEGSEREKDEKI